MILNTYKGKLKLVGIGVIGVNNTATVFQQWTQRFKMQKCPSYIKMSALRPSFNRAYARSGLNFLYSGWYDQTTLRWRLGFLEILKGSF